MSGLWVISWAAEKGDWFDLREQRMGTQRVRFQWSGMQSRRREIGDLLMLGTQSQVPGTWKDVLPSEFMSILPQTHRKLSLRRSRCTAVPVSAQCLLNKNRNLLLFLTTPTRWQSNSQIRIVKCFERWYWGANQKYFLHTLALWIHIPQRVWCWKKNKSSKFCHP